MADQKNEEVNLEVDQVDFKELLVRWNLQIYAATFQNQGQTDVTKWDQLTEDALISDMNLKKPHAIKFVRKYNDFKQGKDIPQKNRRLTKLEQKDAENEEKKKLKKKQMVEDFKKRMAGAKQIQTQGSCTACIVSIMDNVIWGEDSSKIDEEDLIQMFDEFWGDSTHRYLYIEYDNKEKRKLAFGVLALQIFVYIILIIASFVNTETGIPTSAFPILTTECDGSLMSSENWSCETSRLDFWEFYPGAVLAAMLVLVFIFPDMWAALLSCRGEKYVTIGGIIFLEGFVGLIAGFVAGRGGSTLDLVVNAVGVIFIHGVDEKIYEVSDHLSDFKRRAFYGVIFLVGVVPLAIGVIAAYLSGGGS